MQENWVYNKEVVGEKDIKALQKAKDMERRDIQNGHRYVKINERMRVLVPFGQDGKPTEAGERIIRAAKGRMI